MWVCGLWVCVGFAYVCIPTYIARTTSQSEEIARLLKHQGSLWYIDPRFVCNVHKSLKVKYLWFDGGYHKILYVHVQSLKVS